MNKPKKPKISKSDFIKELSSMTREDINKIILEKGKPIKPISPVIFRKF